MTTIRVRCAGCATVTDVPPSLHEELETDAWFAALTAGCGQP